MALGFCLLAGLAGAPGASAGASADDSRITPTRLIVAPEPPAGTPAQPPAAEPDQRRPRIGLVLSGGGARGLAHVGVLKVLEEMQIPVDVVAGTSMGAIVGGLYASGMRADEIARELKLIRWGEVFASRVARPQLSQRRKEEDFETSPLIELGLRDGELRTPGGAVSSRGLESLLRRLTLPVRQIDRFDALPIPFRAVATDMETGQPVVLDRGDLALALRSSMSVPGVFAPTEVDGRVLGDGGLVDNLPVDVARALGADVVIAVNIGTPLSGRETLGSAVGLTAQMINILTEQNVRRSLASLSPRDVLIAPALGALTSGDFDAAPQFLALGEAGARGRSDQLAALSQPAAAYAAWRAERLRPASPPTRIAEVRIEGTTYTNPERLAAMLESRPGQVFDAGRAERDSRRLAAGGDYARSDYQLKALPAPADGDVLVFDLEDKSWGPNYLHAGLDMGTDFRGQGSFNLKLSHNRHWLTRNGTEWRNQVQIGSVPRVFSELYHPLAWTASRADDWFVAAYAAAERRRQWRYDADNGLEQALLNRGSVTLGADLGQPWGEFGELRFGVQARRLRSSPRLVAAGLATPPARLQWEESALRARAVVDQLDYAVFPQSGYRGQLELWSGRRTGDLSGSFWHLETEGTAVRSWGDGHTLALHAQLNTAEVRGNIGTDRYSLGGFHRLSGYQSGQLSGNHTLLMRLAWYQRLSQTPSLTRGFFIGGSVEAGNAWAARDQITLGHLRTGFSLFLGADTAIGPLYVAFTYAPRGAPGLAIYIGRP